MGRKKKISLFEAYLQLCFGKKLLIEGKAYSYRQINKGKACSFLDFEKFIEQMKVKKNTDFVQLTLFD